MVALNRDFQKSWDDDLYDQKCFDRKKITYEQRSTDICKKMLQNDLNFKNIIIQSLVNNSWMAAV